MKKLDLTNKEIHALLTVLVDTVDYLKDDLVTTIDSKGNEVEEKIEDYEIHKVLTKLQKLK
tara:strand:+ start:356 stop:538 length:183 start_codon:yes stop_codon:yes gene_type:complete